MKMSLECIRYSSNALNVLIMLMYLIKYGLEKDPEVKL